MTFKLGLTGSIGMGKSTTAQMFVDGGCALWDADAAVHRLYGAGGAAVAPMAAAFPDVIVDGEISRPALRALIDKDPSVLRSIEEIVHPLVAQDRAEFARAATADIAVFDIPLLFETGANAQMDAVVCVSILTEEQEKRVLARGTMTAEQLENIRARQMPNSEKMGRSDFVIKTDTLEHAAEQVQDVLRQIREKIGNA